MDLKTQELLALTAILAGVGLTVFLGFATDEPNIVTPAMFVCGTIWYVVTKIRSRKAS